jgi:uncharacterized membrane protein YgdD (TMEM256/DUF423 family)
MRKPGGLAALAALSGAAAVTAGAFAAHGMSTGAQYQLVHAVASIAALGWTRGRLAALLLLAGSLLFAGTLYAMAFGAPRWLGAITPLGGAGMIAGWVLLAIAAMRR